MPTLANWAAGRWYLNPHLSEHLFSKQTICYCWKSSDSLAFKTGTRQRVLNIGSVPLKSSGGGGWGRLCHRRYSCAVPRLERPTRMPTAARSNPGRGRLRTARKKLNVHAYVQAWVYLIKCGKATVALWRVRSNTTAIETWNFHHWLKAIGGDERRPKPHLKQRSHFWFENNVNLWRKGSNECNRYVRSVDWPNTEQQQQQQGVIVATCKVFERHAFSHKHFYSSRVEGRPSEASTWRWSSRFTSVGIKACKQTHILWTRIQNIIHNLCFCLKKKSVRNYI